MVQELKGHAHWINTLTLHNEFVLKSGCNDQKQKSFKSDKERLAYAKERLKKVSDPKGERLVSGSDDYTMILWQPKQSKKPV